jgi:hypothetical protein
MAVALLLGAVRDARRVEVRIGSYSALRISAILCAFAVYKPWAFFTAETQRNAETG